MDLWQFLSNPSSHALTLAIGAVVASTVLYKWFYIPERKRSDKIFELYEAALKRILSKYNNLPPGGENNHVTNIPKNPG